MAFPVLLFSYGGCFEVQLQVMEKLRRTEQFAGYGAIWIWSQFLQAKADHKPREANFFLYIVTNHSIPIQYLEQGHCSVPVAAWSVRAFDWVINV